MATREDGEFELVLGNKQLLSVLFIVIVLLGVFFAMGFIAGRSTGGGGSLVADKSISSADGTPEKRPVTEAAPVPMTSEPSLAPPPPASVAPPIPGTKAEPEPKAEPAKPPTAAAASKSGFTEKPAAGIYLQVAAALQSDAEAMHAMLLTHGLKGCVTPAPKNPTLMRVLVGPFSTKEQVAPVREKLKAIGIDKAYTVSYE